VRLRRRVAGYHSPVTSERDESQDPTDAEVVGVPPQTPPAVEPSATGTVVGPLDEPANVDVEDLRVDPDAGDGATAG
jgi:hypothetical protein